jgi:ferric-dicitrate binding protein FerR (iron transport regulator)
MQGLDEYMQQLLIRYLDNEATESERVTVKEWLSHPANQAYFEGLKKLHAKVTDTQHATPANVNVDAAWEKVAAKTTQKGLQVVKPKVSWNVLLRIAAVLVIGFSIFWWIAKDNVAPPNQMATLITMKTTDSTLLVNLPDGSRVTLNQYSSLSYPENFEEDKRSVELKGEAFFDISRDTGKPFTIKTGETNIRVLGTSFLVKNEKDSGVAVYVKTGKVQLYKTSYKKAAVVLTKGEQGFLAKAETKAVKQTITDINYLSQYDKTLRFENTPLNLVLKDLEKQYKVTFEVNPTTIEGCRITAKFEESTLNEILETLKIYFSWEIQQNKNTVTIKGKGCY